MAKSRKRVNAAGRRSRVGGANVVRVRRGHAGPSGRVVTVAELDPLERCGEETSVQKLLRVEERDGHRLDVHLVFLDRHGWYCVHGADCGAVADARKFAEMPATARRVGRKGSR